MWKLRHGFPLYEWPTQPYFSLTLYNALFYKVYAAVFTILRTPEPATPVVGRFVTLGFAVLGPPCSTCSSTRPGRRAWWATGWKGSSATTDTIPQAGGEPLRVPLRAHPLKAV
jgi:hypothetical protein